MIDLLALIKTIDKKKQSKIAKTVFFLSGIFVASSILIANLRAIGDPQQKTTLVTNRNYARLSQLVNSKLEISNSGIDLIETYEGKHLQAYLDPVDIPTIGYGHTKDVKLGQTITEAQAIDFLNQDIKTSASGILTYVKTPITQDQFDALVSFHFNLGADVLASDPILSDAINSNDWETAKRQISKYVKADGQTLDGLVRRRQAEIDLIK